MKIDLDPIRERNPGYSFTQRTRNHKVYITITPKRGMDFYHTLLDILRKEFKGIRITSGSGFAMCGVLPTLFELIEQSEQEP